MNILLVFLQTDLDGSGYIDYEEFKGVSSPIVRIKAVTSFCAAMLH